MPNRRHCASRDLCITATLIVVFLSNPVKAFPQACPSETIKRNRAALVFIHAAKTRKQTGQVEEERTGTGFLVSPSGYVLTNRHVIQFDDKTDEIEISGSLASRYAQTSRLEVIDENGHDVALLKFADTSKTYPIVGVRNPTELNVKVGTPLCAIGFPMNQEFIFVSGSMSGGGGERGFWLTDMPSNPGDSGAPVFVASGEVVAIKVGGYDDAQNINLLIPLNLAQGLLIEVPDLRVNFYEVKATQVYTDEQLIEKTIQAGKSLLSTVGQIQTHGKTVPATGEEKGETFELFSYLREQGYIPVNSLSAAADFQPGSIISVGKAGELHPIAAMGEVFQNLAVASTPVSLPKMSFKGRTKSGRRDVLFACGKAVYEGTSINSLQNNLGQSWRDKLEQDKSLYVVYGIVACDDMTLDYESVKTDSDSDNSKATSLHASTKQVLGIKLASLHSPI